MTRKMEMPSTEKGDVRGKAIWGKKRKFAGLVRPAGTEVQTAPGVQSWSPRERARLEVQIWESVPELTVE